MLIAVFPVLLLLIGLLMYALSTNAKVVEIGRWIFVIGLFWLTYALSGKTIKIG